MRSISFLIPAFIVLVSIFAACKDQLPTQGDYLSIVLPDSNISYSKNIEPLFTAACVSCHSGSYAPDLIPPSYSSLMNYGPNQLVVAGTGSTSLLVELLDGRAQPSMPPTGPRLTQNQVNGIKRWIDEGAQNN